MASPSSAGSGRLPHRARQRGDQRVGPRDELRCDLTGAFTYGNDCTNADPSAVTSTSGAAFDCSNRSNTIRPEPAPTPRIPASDTGSDRPGL